MPVTEQLMKVGSFEVRFDRAPVGLVGRNIAGFASIVVTPTRMTDLSAVRATLLEQARWRGVIFGWSDDRQVVRGEGMLSWLGDGGGVGQGVRLSAPLTPDDFEGWWDYYEALPRTNGLTKGATYSMPATTWPAASSNTVPPYNVRETFEMLAQALGVEYRANPDGTVDMGAVGSALFTTAPTVLVSRWTTGVDASLTSFPVERWRVSKDYDDYLNFVRVEKAPDGVGSAAFNVETLQDASGAAALMRATVVTDAGVEDTGDCEARGEGILSQHEAVRVEVECSVEVFDPGRFMRPGDSLYVWDPIDQLWNTGNQVTFQGETIHPASQRLRGMTWPIQEGMGVYLLANDADDSYLDVTDWVAFESGPTRLEIGASRRTAFD